ncbi:MAG: translation initiation factor IF-2 [Candidatus Magasanikbacteria bacterium]|nr:translation initiation factor IF-2 [Candidatus Magasanikbacteria bacterium]
MNVSELARQLRVHPKEMMLILPQYGFDIGARAVKIDDRVATQIVRRWRFIKKDQEEKKRRELEEKKLKEKAVRRELGQVVALPERITVRQFAERLGLPLTQVITELMQNGILANQNQFIDFDTAAIMAGEFGFTANREAVSSAAAAKEDDRAQALELALAKSTKREPRAPVVVVMGHVDHGKTTLLDTIRRADIASGEAGGITQHIGAYQTKWKDPKSGAERLLTFIDTPGHEAFTVMRSRGAKVADVAILVVAADDGVKPQTDEVIQIIRAAKLPVVVAMNKIDKPGADVQRVRSELSERGIISEEWGGETPLVEISAKNKLNIDKLLDVLLLVSDMHGEQIQADPAVPAAGTVIESHLDKHMGPVATILVQAGTLRKNDPLVVNGEIYGKVRAMKDYQSNLIDAAPPSMPVQIIGFKVAPEVGDILDISRAASATKIDVKQKKVRQTGAERVIVRMDEVPGDDEAPKKTLNLVVKADVLGSLEAIIGSLEKIRHDEVAVRVVGKGLGNITDDDVHKATAAQATVVGFHVNASPAAQDSMRESDVPFLRYEIIYDLINWVKGELEKMLVQEKIITELGRLNVMAIFRTDKGAMTVGGRVEEGKVQKGARARVRRGGEASGEGKIATCQIGKQEMKEVPAGTECGLRFEGKPRLEVGDVLEFYTEESKARKIIFLK